MTSIPIIDDKAFKEFAELMGPALAEILKKHCTVAEGYLATITDSIESGNFKAASNAAHPLKSSSEQIGAMKVAALAKEIEHLAKLDVPNQAKLKTLAEQVVHAQAEALEALSHSCEGRNLFNL